MFSLEAIGLFFKTFFSKLSLKGILIFLGVLLLAFGQWKFYEWAQHRQAATDQVTINDLKGKNDQLKKQMNDETTQVETWKGRASKAEVDFDTLQKTTVADLQNKLSDANARAAAWEKKAKTPKEITKYVTVHDDSLCTINAGFVQLFDDSIEADTTAHDAGFVSSGPGVSYGSPTTLKLSQLSSVLIHNNAEAVRRGKVIQIWQSWYTSTSANWTRVQQEIAAGVPPETALKHFTLAAPQGP